MQTGVASPPPDDPASGVPAPFDPVPGDPPPGDPTPGGRPPGAPVVDGPDREGAGRVLSALELAVLELERRRYRHQGAKEQAVRDEVDLSATQYHQVLNALLDEPVALEHDPVTVSRLRRLRAQRMAGRAR